VDSDASGSLGGVFAEFEGIVGGIGTRGSHARDRGELVVLALVFEDNLAGRAAELATRHILSRLGTGTRLDGRAPVSADATLDCGSETADAAFYGLSKQQTVVFERALRYAMDMGYDPYADRSSGPGASTVPSSCTPLFVSLCRAFETFRGCYETARGDHASAPSLGIWSNVLRPFDENVLDQRELIRRGVLSRRAVRALVRDLERLGWLAVEKPGRGRTSLRLTAAGQRAREVGAGLVEAAESGFVTRFGLDRFDELRTALVDLVDQREIELPWYLTGYGLADTSLTGGSHVPAEVGPPRVPAHGTDWPVVLRDSSADPAREPLSALLSKALAAFRIDYEWDMRGHGTGLDFVANFLQFVDDDGVDLKTASALGDVTGNGKSALERHLVVVVETRQGRGVPRNVYLTPKGKQARDTHRLRVAAVEADWLDRYGDCITRLRGALGSLDGDFEASLPNFPSTTEWLYRSMLAGSVAHRLRTSSHTNKAREQRGNP